MEEKEKILNFIASQYLAVISTINKFNMPESAVVAFSQTPNLEIILGTFSTSRKYRNIENNNKVSLVIGWDENEKTTVQYEGKAHELIGEEMERLSRNHIEKNPGSKRYHFNLDQRYIKIAPSWIRYSDFSKKPEEIFEISF